MSDSSNTTRVFVGHLSSQTTVRDLEHAFRRYGRVCRVDLKIKGYAFVDMSRYEEAANAVHRLHDTELNNRRMIVEFATVKEERCTECGIYGHLADSCRGCYICGQRGHTGMFCNNVRKDIRHERRSPSRSRSRGPSHGGRRRSYSRSRSPPKRYITHEPEQPMSRDHDSQQLQYPQPRHCFRCGLPGHYARDCIRYKCFRCGEKGHIKKDCRSFIPSNRYRSPPPSRGQYHSRRRRSYSRSMSRSPPRRNLTPEHDGHVPRNSRQTRPPSPKTRNHSCSPGVRNGSPVLGLVDTGSPVLGLIDYPKSATNMSNQKVPSQDGDGD